MKQGFHSVPLLLFFFFLISSSKSAARLLVTEQGQNIKLDKVTREDFVSEVEDNESLQQLMGMEGCNNGDEECLKRRTALEAHLDYIYTQQHKP